MGTEQTKQLASAFFARLTANDLAGALDLVADDATWWIPGKPGQLPAAGVHTKQGITRIIQTMVEQLTSGLRMTVKSAIAEGDRVALEVESYGELRNGRVYNQEYHVLMTIRDGKISAVREYLDTQHAFAVWFQP
jgi:ketosteroid isomerase-like protein